MTSFEPVKLSFEVIEAVTGTDETLSPIIFLHGLFELKDTWDGITQRVADVTKRKVYAYDARNHGESSYIDSFTFDLNVDDLFYFMDTNSITKAILVGHSMGGITAARAALKKPERVEKLFVEDMFVKKVPQDLIDIGLPLDCARQESVQHIPKGLTMKEAIDFSNNFVIDMIPEDSPYRSRIDELRKSKVNLKKNQDEKWELCYNSDVIIKALSNADTWMTEPKGLYVGPAYFLYGPLSMLNVQNEEDAIKKHFPNAELIEIAGANHMIHSDFTEDFVKNLLNNL